MKFDKEQQQERQTEGGGREQRIDLIDPDRGVTINKRLPEQQILFSHKHVLTTIYPYVQPEAIKGFIKFEKHLNELAIT